MPFGWLKLAVPIGLVVAASVGFVPRLTAQGSLNQWASDAARAGATAPSDKAVAAARRSAESHPGAVFVGYTEQRAGGVTSGTVVLRETVHTYLSGWPGVKSWFRISATETTVGGN